MVENNDFNFRIDTNKVKMQFKLDRPIPYSSFSKNLIIKLFERIEKGDEIRFIDTNVAPNSEPFDLEVLKNNVTLALRYLKQNNEHLMISNSFFHSKTLEKLYDYMMMVLDFRYSYKAVEFYNIFQAEETFQSASEHINKVIDLAQRLKQDQGYDFISSQQLDLVLSFKKDIDLDFAYKFFYKDGWKDVSKYKTEEQALNELYRFTNVYKNLYRQSSVKDLPFEQKFSDLLEQVDTVRRLIKRFYDSSESVRFILHGQWRSFLKILSRADFYEKIDEYRKAWVYENLKNADPSKSYFLLKQEIDTRIKDILREADLYYNV